MKGPGDTFDVSWSHDGALLSACFSSGTLVVQDASVYKDVNFGSTLIAHENLENIAETTEPSKTAPSTVPSTTTTSSSSSHVGTSKGSKHGASAASRSHSSAQHHQQQQQNNHHADVEVSSSSSSSGSRSITDKGEKGEKVTELKTDKVKGRSDSVATTASATNTAAAAAAMKVEVMETPVVGKEATAEFDAMQVDSFSGNGYIETEEEYPPVSSSSSYEETSTPMDEVAASTVGDSDDVNDMVTDEMAVVGKDKEDADL